MPFTNRPNKPNITDGTNTEISEDNRFDCRHILCNCALEKAAGAQFFLGRICVSANESRRPFCFAKGVLITYLSLSMDQPIQTQTQSQNKRGCLFYGGIGCLAIVVLSILGFIILAVIGSTALDSVNNRAQQRQTNEPVQNADTTVVEPEQPKEEIVSTNFDDFSILCDTDATNLQKQDQFDKQFKDKYVQWTGTIQSISETFGSYTLQVKHCPDSFLSDIVVTLKDDQKDALLKYKEDDTITYKAKLTRLGDILGLSASDGEIITQ